jgi:hypothetical protein
MWRRFVQRRHRILLALLSALGVLVVSIDAGGQSPSPRKVRTIHITGQPIAESLRPDDEIVELAPLGEGASHLRQPPPVLFESSMRRGESSVVRVDVTGVSGVLAAEGTFVWTKFVGTIVEVLKVGKARGARPAMVVGRAIEFSNVGGEVAIGGVVVRSSFLVQYPYPAQYVAVLNHLQHENGWAVGLSPPLRVLGDTLEPVAPQKSLLTGLSLSEMRRIIKAAR